MSTMNRRLHDRALELAATGLDFTLAGAEAAELEAHLGACRACARSAAALRADTATLRRSTGLLPSRRVDDAVYAAIAGRDPRASSQRMLVLVAATVLLLVALLGVAAAGAFILRTWPTRLAVITPSPSAPAVVIDGTPSTAPAPSPSFSPSPSASTGPSPVPGTLPVGAGSVRMAPGPDGGLYVVVNGSPSGSVVSLLAASGTPRTGWPIRLDGWNCDAPNGPFVPVVASDGSIRVVCLSEAPSDAAATVRAFAFDLSGRLLPGWPVDLPERVWDQPRVVGDRLVIAANESSDQEPYPGAYWLVAVAADGTVRTGTRYEIATDAVSPVAIGPEGIAYRTAGNEITAFDLDGVRPGWPIRVEGVLSGLAFGPDGRIYLTATSTDAGTSRLLAFDRDGQPAPVASDPLPVVGASAWSGAGPSGVPLAPLVAADGTAFVIGEAGGRATVYGFDASGKVMSGWSYRAAAGLPWQGSLGQAVTGGGLWRSVPVVGPDRVVYLPQAAPDAQIGGSLVAVGPDGQALPGWPMHLARRGAEFWSVVVGSDGTVFALAVEPETGGKSSATVLAIAKDATVLSRTTVVEP